MAILRRQQEIPPDFRYVQMETGCDMTAATPGQLVRKVIEHRLHKGLGPLEPEEVWLEIQRQICSGLGPIYCRPEPGEKWRPIKSLARELTLEKVQAFSEGLIAFFRSGARLVDEEVAKARGDTCRGCRFNIHAKGCLCEPFYKLIALLVPKARQQKDLRICAACGCSLQAKVNLPDESVRQSNAGRDLVFPDYCWQAKLN
jgi:hypothetical protein